MIVKIWLIYIYNIAYNNAWWLLLLSNERERNDYRVNIGNKSYLASHHNPGYVIMSRFLTHYNEPKISRNNPDQLCVRIYLVYLQVLCSFIFKQEVLKKKNILYAKYMLAFICYLLLFLVIISFNILKLV